MNKVYKWMSDELKYYKRLHSRLLRRLNRIEGMGSEKRLSFHSVKGKMYYSEVWFEDGIKKSRYLGPSDNKDVMDAQELRFLRKAIEAVDRRITALEKNAAMINSESDRQGELDYLKINESLPKVYRMSDEQVKQIIGPDEGERWYADAIREKARLDALYPVKYPHGLVHTAKDGTVMRSKSEMLIANELISKGIPYIYEMPVAVRHIVMHPDLMFYSYSRRKPIMWEHAGMLGDEDYMSDFATKMDTYIRGGLIPCDDILFTFDTTDGRLDMRIIESLIEEYR